ncbi:MAG: hypothetical protein WC861_04815 [Candidatus Micrarchaeia archaeon]|jgi:hypothetical protein
MATFQQLDNIIPGCRHKNDAKKQVYIRKDDGIINRDTGKRIGIFTHYGEPNPSERACNIKVGGKNRMAAYLPLHETEAE